MPVFIAPLVGFALGALLAWLSAASSRHTGAPPHRVPLPRRGDIGPLRFGGNSGWQVTEHRPLVLASLYGLLVYTPVCAYFLVFAPDWSFAYLVDSRKIPSAIDLLLLMADTVSVPMGFLALGRAGAQRSLRAFGGIAGVPLAVAALIALVLGRRLSLEGSYRQVHGGFGVHAVAGGPLGYAILWMHGLLIAGLAFAARAMLEGSRAGERRSGQGESVQGPVAGSTAATARSLPLSEKPPTGMGDPLRTSGGGASGRSRLLGAAPHGKTRPDKGD
ncbi:hypothetical protein [Chondromyces apiculatus]|uniref:hypothetical protein n=1 Tax=Chondromyces apiculatus TaxID=51 RepID=UPI0012DC1226|nr:hypothetical protein [Chondromyces apiculatus]